MLLRSLVWFVLLAGGAGLMAGCRVTPPQSASSSAAASGRVKASAVPEEDVVEAHAHYCSGIVHEMNDEPAEALREYYLAALKDPEDEDLVIEVSRRLLQANQVDKSLEILTRAVALPDASAAVYARLGFTLSRLGRFDAALKADRMAIRKDPRLLLGYENLFLNDLQSRNPKEAFQVLEQAAAVPQTDAEFLVSLGELYANLGLQVSSLRPAAYAGSFAVLQRAERMKIEDPQLRLRLADGYNILGKDAPAARIYTELLKELPDLPLVRENIRAKLTDIYLRGPDHKMATEQLLNLVRENPTDVQAYYLLGRLSYEDKRYADAADYLGKTVLLNPDLEPAYYELADAQISQDKDADALVTLTQAKQRFSQNFTLEYLSGLACSRLKDYTNAIQHFNSAEIVARAASTNRFSEAMSLFYFQYGAACERIGDFAQAEIEFKKCLQLEPASGEALNYLGFMWADRGVNLNQARDLIDKALKVDPDNAAYLDSMGWVLYKQHRPGEALGYILKAIQLSKPEDAILYDHLGDVYQALGESDKARGAWQKSLALEANDEVRKKLASSKQP
jgi:tetratricopeptide (TPR) repeat protein